MNWASCKLLVALQIAVSLGQWENRNGEFLVSPEWPRGWEALSSHQGIQLAWKPESVMCFGRGVGTGMRERCVGPATWTSDFHSG